ncbi:MAG: glycosyltransferase family 39 protein [Rhodospirillales bacterium]|nr:glycosyltransferase family 39 protein [Alphaproteobacteria bacterium]MCB9986529.1 glycosyltransferase family 39 protein [Rhodospirillales bacterium]USO06935.1 MAG: glycosyltransferase family 39 protein [Rhodospirillales bacterium]
MTAQTKTVTVLAAGWVALFAAIAFTRPLMPVDETRYLTVAWEMLVRHDWVLPTLNFAPYSHKPPMLFWLVRIAWSVFGVGLWQARLVPLALGAALAFISARLARRLFDSRAAVYAALALGMMPMLLIYASTIMFDVMMAVWVVAAMLTLWRIATEGRTKLWFAWGAILGGAALAKGPVALVYILPAALLAPFWAPPQKWARWYGCVLGGVLMGTAIGLAWAVPAALSGGGAYAEKIFVTQSAGRMVNAFAHRRPFWFYIPVVLALLAPLLAWPTMWAAARRFMRAPDARAPIRFIACWVVPAFVFFSAISSKQFHYMLPLMPGVAILAGAALARADEGGAWPRPRSAVWPILLMLVPTLGVMGAEALHLPLMGVRLDRGAEIFGLGPVMLAAGLIWWLGRDPAHASGRAPVTIVLAAFSLAIFMHLQTGARFLPRYDMRPIASAAQDFMTRPMAVAPKYDGEYGFLFRMRAPFDSIGREDVESWLKAHPDGVVVARYDHGQMPGDFRVLFTQTYRNNEDLVLLTMPKAE